MSSEVVLCLKRQDLPVTWMGPETALALSRTARQELLANTPIYWQSRQTVETDASYKQLVPYVVLHNPEIQHNRKVQVVVDVDPYYF